MENYFNIILPLKPQDVLLGDRFMDYLIDFDLLKQSQEKVDIVSQTPFTKLYFLSQSLPESIQKLIDGKQIQIQEVRKDFQKHLKTFTILQFQDVSIEIECKIVKAVCTQNVYDNNQKVDMVDVIKEPLDYFKGYEKDIIRKLSQIYGINDPNNWINQVKDNCTVACQIKIKSNFGEDTQLIQTFMSDQMRKFLLYYYKSMVLTYRNWYQKTEKQLFEQNLDVIQQQQSKSFALNVYGKTINGYNDLVNKTCFNEVKKKYFGSYKLQPQQIVSQYFGQAQSNLSQSSRLIQIQSSQSSPENTIKTQLQRKKAGLIYKRGDGPIDYNWNLRYIFLDAETLVYFKNQFDKVPRGFIDLRDAYVSNVHNIEDRDFAFYVDISSQRKFYFSGENKEDSQMWRDEFYKGTLHHNDSIFHSDIKYKSINQMPSKLYLITQNIPTPLLKYTTIIQNMSNMQENTDWIFRKFRNGVKIYEKMENIKNNKKTLKKFLLFAGIIILMFGITLWMKEITNLPQILLSLGVLLISSSFITKTKIINKREVYARIITEVEASQAFQMIKDFKHKKIFDPNFVNVTKSSSKEDSKDFVKKATSQFQIAPMIKSKTSTQSQRKIINVEIKRYRFILLADTYFVVDVCSSPSLEMVEIFQMKSNERVIGKGQLNYYCQVIINSSEPNLSKYLTRKAENLSLVGSTIDDQKFQQFSNNMSQDLNQIDEMQRITIENIQQIDSTMIEEQIIVVNQLKNGSCNVEGKILEDRKLGYKRYIDGGMECFNREEIRAQDGLVVDLMRQAGRQLMEGKSVVGISLPVRIFEPRSTIERICDSWAFMPIYFRLASRTNDQVERFKLVVAGVMAGLYNGSKQKKPFNPILGETFQANWQDGSSVFVEHTSHHPPVSHFQFNDVEKKYKFSGHYEYQAALKYNAVVGRQFGLNVLEFYDGQRIVYEMPHLKVSGLLFGSRIIDWLDSVKFVDERRGLICDVKFSEGAGLLMGRDSKPTDCFEGSLLQNNNPIAKVTGSWLQNCDWDDVRYWDLEKLDPVVLIHVNNPLPSDCRFRSDLIELSRGELDNAQEEKTRLEVLQRKEMRLRTDYKKPLLK